MRCLPNNLPVSPSTENLLFNASRWLQNQVVMVAARLGLSSVGLLGALIEAKHRCLILAIKPIVDDLITTAGFWINQTLYEQVLHVAGE